MGYKQFTEKLGNLDVPSGDVHSRLIKGQDSIHVTVSIGEVSGTSYSLFISDAKANFIFKAIELLESRGAIRGKDYVVCCNLDDNRFWVGVHSTDSFLCDEDFIL